MKFGILHLFLITFLFFSCGNKENKKTELETSSTIHLVKTANEMQENKETLIHETPLTKEQFEAWMPKTVLGMPLTSSAINMISGMGSCGCTYSVNNRRVRVMIFDGAGEKGNNAVNTYRFSSTREYDEKGSWGYTKSNMINGIKVKESGLKSGKFSLSMFYNNRFAVDVETYEVSHDELEQIVKDLNLEQLH